MGRASKRWDIQCEESSTGRQPWMWILKRQRYTENGSGCREDDTVIQCLESPKIETRLMSA